MPKAWKHEIVKYVLKVNTEKMVTWNSTQLSLTSMVEVIINHFIVIIINIFVVKNSERTDIKTIAQCTYLHKNFKF